MVEEMNYTYVVSCVDDGDGGAEIDRFTNKTDAIKCWFDNVAEYPDKTFDVAVEDEDSEWIDIISPFEEEGR